MMSPKVQKFANDIEFNHFCGERIHTCVQWMVCGLLSLLQSSLFSFTQPTYMYSLLSKLFSLSVLNGLSLGSSSKTCAASSRYIFETFASSVQGVDCGV